MPEYPPASYQSLYNTTLEPLWEPANGLAPDEDGSHHNSAPKFFEWWYFDAALDNGLRLVIIFHSAVFNLTSRPPAVDIRLTSPDREPLISFKVYKQEQCRAEMSRCEVQIGDCHVTAETSQKYLLQIQQENFSANLVYQSSLPGWKPGTGHLFHDQTSGHFFKWVVPIPLGKVSGDLQVGQEKFKVKGVGYHDHNWGNIHLEEAFRHWHWGRFISADQQSAFVFGDVVSKADQAVRIKPVLLVSEGEIQPQPEIMIDYLNPQTDKISGVNYAQQIRISNEGADHPFEFQLTSDKVLEALNFASPIFQIRPLRIATEILFYLTFTKPWIGRLSKKFLGSAGYLRFQAQAQLKVEHPEQMLKSGEAIYEIMSFD